MNGTKLLGFGLGPLVTGALGLMTVPLLAWLYAPEVIGRFYLAQTVVSIAVTVVCLGMDQAYVREFHGAIDRPRLLLAAVIPGFVSLGVLTAAAGLVAAPLAHMLFGLDDARLIWLTLAAIALSFGARHFGLVLRMNERAISFSLVQIVPKVMLLLILGIFIVASFGSGFAQVLSAYVAATLMAVAFSFWIIRGDVIAALRSIFSAELVGKMFRFGIPLMLAGLVYSGLAAVGLFALRASSTLFEVGVYSVVMSFAGVAALLQAIFSTVWAPIIYRWASEGSAVRGVQLVSQRLTLIVLGIIAACGALAWIVDALLPTSYSSVKYLLVCAMLPSLLYSMSEVLGAGISIARRTQLALWVALIAFASSVGFNLLLTPLYGAAGALAANALAYCVYLVGKTEVAARVWEPVPRAWVYACLSGVVVLSIATAVFGATAGMVGHALWGATAVGLMLLFRKEYVATVKTLFRRTDGRA